MTKNLGRQANIVSSEGDTSQFEPDKWNNIPTYFWQYQAIDMG